MIRILITLFTLISSSSVNVLGQCPSAFTYSTGLAPSLPINQGATDSFPGLLTLNTQILNVTTSINATGIAIYPSTSGQVGPYNITGGIYTINSSNTLTMLRRTGFVTGSNWSTYDQTTSLSPLILPFDRPIALAAVSYYLVFWAVNLTATTPLGVIVYATPSNNVETISLPMHGTFDYVPSTITIGSERAVVTPGFLTSIVSQPSTCSSSSSSSSSSTGGTNGVLSSHSVSQFWIFVIWLALAVVWHN